MLVIKLYCLYTHIYSYIQLYCLLHSTTCDHSFLSNKVETCLVFKCPCYQQEWLWLLHLPCQVLWNRTSLERKEIQCIDWCLLASILFVGFVLKWIAIKLLSYWCKLDDSVWSCLCSTVSSNVTKCTQSCKKCTLCRRKIFNYVA